MAQNISLLGASYPDVPSVLLPKTGGGTAQFDDTTIASNAAAAGDIASGKLAYVNGTLVTGTASGGGGGTLITKSITANGTYNASDDSADGYSSVTVNVSGGSATPKVANFYDYDGTLLYSYTAAEASALTELPANPTHTGLTAQGWNYTLAQVKSEITNQGAVNVGQMYDTDDHETRIHICIEPDTTSSRMTFYVRFTASTANNTTIYWGDGTSETAGSTTATDYSHTYSATGAYTIRLATSTGTIKFVGSSSYAIYGASGSSNTYNRSRIRAVEFGNKVTSIGSYAFYQCYHLASVAIPSSVISIGTYAFSTCFSLTYATIPSEITVIEANAFSSCYSLEALSITSGVTGVNGSAFRYCYSLSSLIIPSSVKSIGTYALSACYSLASFFIPSGVTSVGADAFQNCYSLKSISIPDGVTNMSASILQSCYSLARLDLPSGVTTFGGSALSNCYSLTSLTIPSNVASINGSVFASCYGISEYHFKPTSPPTLTNTNAFSNIASDCIIYVPRSENQTVLNAYKTANNWSTYASKMQEEPE